MTVNYSYCRVLNTFSLADTFYMFWRQTLVARNYHRPFLNFLFMYLFSIKFLYHFIYFSLFLIVFMFMYSYNLMVTTTFICRPYIIVYTARMNVRDRIFHFLSKFQCYVLSALCLVRRKPIYQSCPCTVSTNSILYSSVHQFSERPLTPPSAQTSFECRNVLI